MYCTECGKRIKKSAKVCRHCKSLVNPLNYPTDDEKTILITGKITSAVGTVKPQRIQKKPSSVAVFGAVVIALMTTLVFLVFITSFNVDKTLLEQVESGDYQNFFSVYSQLSTSKKEKVNDKFIKRAEELLSDFNNSRINYTTAREKIEAMYNISSAPQLFIYSKDIDVLKKSKENFMKAQEFENSDHIIDAINYYSLVSSQDTNYSQAEFKKKDLLGKYKTTMLKTAQGFSDKNNPDAALDLLKNNYSFFYNDSDINAAIETYSNLSQKNNSQKIRLEAKKEYNAGNYKTAVELYLSADGLDGIDIQTLNSAKDAYKDEIVAKASNLADTGSYEEAIIELNTLLDMFYNEEVKQIVNDYSQFIPVDLFSLTPIWGSSYKKESAQDNLGNSFSGYVMTCSNTPSATFLTDGDHTTLSGSVSLYNGSKNITSTLWIEFYNGDELLYSSPALTRGSRSVDFSFDISGVPEITFKPCSSDGYGRLCTKGFFLER